MLAARHYNVGINQFFPLARSFAIHTYSHTHERLTYQTVCTPRLHAYGIVHSGFDNYYKLIKLTHSRLPFAYTDVVLYI